MVGHLAGGLRGGMAIGIIVVGVLMGATTGIVGATVITSPEAGLDDSSVFVPSARAVDAPKSVAPAAANRQIRRRRMSVKTVLNIESPHVVIRARSRRNRVSRGW